MISNPFNFQLRWLLSDSARFSSIGWDTGVIETVIYNNTSPKIHRETPVYFFQ